MSVWKQHFTFKKPTEMLWPFRKWACSFTSHLPSGGLPSGGLCFPELFTSPIIWEITLLSNFIVSCNSKDLPLLTPSLPSPVRELSFFTLSLLTSQLLPSHLRCQHSSLTTIRGLRQAFQVKQHFTREFAGVIVVSSTSERLGTDWEIASLSTLITRNLEEQHLIFRLGPLQLSGIDTDFSGFCQPTFHSPSLPHPSLLPSPFTEPSPLTLFKLKILRSHLPRKRQVGFAEQRTVPGADGFQGAGNVQSSRGPCELGGEDRAVRGSLVDLQAVAEEREGGRTRGEPAVPRVAPPPVDEQGQRQSDERSGEQKFHDPRSWEQLRNKDLNYWRRFAAFPMSHLKGIFVPFGYNDTVHLSCLTLFTSCTTICPRNITESRFFTKHHREQILHEASPRADSSRSITESRFFTKHHREQILHEASPRADSSRSITESRFFTKHHREQILHEASPRADSSRSITESRFFTKHHREQILHEASPRADSSRSITESRFFTKHHREQILHEASPRADSSRSITESRFFTKHHREQILHEASPRADSSRSITESRFFTKHHREQILHEASPRADSSRSITESRFFTKHHREQILFF
ncbi:uncharacterized protein [Narcine bancroftii]|uniref:uncharacterized protein n=1 Tax=Narcine bancroftii TaxID=1343680 RepID=UPI0038321D44